MAVLGILVVHLHTIIGAWWPVSSSPGENSEHLFANQRALTGVCTSHHVWVMEHSWPHHWHMLLLQPLIWWLGQMGIQKGHENSCIFKVFSFFVQVRTINMHNFCVIFSRLMDCAANTKVVVSSDLFRLYSMWDSTLLINELVLSASRTFQAPVKSPPFQCQYSMGCKTLPQVFSRYIWGTKGDRNMEWRAGCGLWFLTALQTSLTLLCTHSQWYCNRFSHLAYRSC